MAITAPIPAETSGTVEAPDTIRLWSPRFGFVMLISVTNDGSATIDDIGISRFRTCVVVSKDAYRT